MRPVRVFTLKSLLLVAAVCLCGIAIAGCDDHVQITRDPDLRIGRNQTWAWRPADASPTGDTRPVTSRDVISRGGDTVERDPNGDNAVVRDRVKNAIQQTLTSKGLTQVSDPAAADYLVDYHFAVERRNVTVQTGYPGLVCGPYRCWDSWGWGPAGVGYERIHFREGTIVFDLVQRGSNHLAYRAIGQKPVNRSAFSLTQDEINGLVRHLLKDLKPR
jgi:hypothetical protein